MTRGGRLGMVAAVFALCPSSIVSQGQHWPAPAATLADVPFIPNAGQWPEAVRFGARFPDLDAYFEDDGVTLCLNINDGGSARSRFGAKLTFEAALAEVVLEPIGQSSATYNFIRGASSRHESLPAFERIRYVGVRPGIDVEFLCRDGRLTFDVHVAPNADESTFIVSCDGLANLSVAATGLVFAHPSGALTISTPVGWQKDPALQRRDLQCAVVRLDDRRFRYELPGRDSRLAAVIDPGITWATYLGGQHSDQVKFVDSFGDGSLLIGGVTDSMDYPTTLGSYDPDFDGSGVIEEVFISRLDSTGTLLLASTFLGGAGADIPGDMALDDDDRVIVVGLTHSRDFPVTPDAFHSAFGSPLGDSFLAILDASLARLEYSTCIGGPDLPGAGAGRIATTDGRALVLFGGTSSTQFVGTPGAFDTTFNGVSDGVVMKLDPTLPPATQLVFASLLGGSDLEYGNSKVAVGPSGSIIIGGNTVSTDFPVTTGAFDTNFGGGFNSYIAALSPDGSSLEWATFVKSTGLRDLAVGADGSVTACFDTAGSISPVSSIAFDPTPNGVTDGVICRFNSTGSQLLWGTFLGGQGQDYPLGLDVDASGSTMICGRTNSPNFPTTPGAHDLSFSGACSDGFVAYLSNDGTQLAYGTYLGSGTGLCLEAETIMALELGVALVAGNAPSGFPVTPGAFDTTYNGGSLGDGFVARLPLFTPWTNLGQGLAGTLGIPNLVGTGWLVAGDLMTLGLSRARPSSTAAIIVGLSELSAPFKGGVLVPTPSFIVSGLPTSSAGTLSLSSPWPPGVPHNLSLYFQAWIVDPVAIAGLSASNALLAKTP